MAELIVAQIVAAERMDIQGEPFLPQALDLHRVRIRHRMTPATTNAVQQSLIGPIRWYGPTETKATTVAPSDGTLRKLYAPAWKSWTLVEAVDKKMGAASEKP